MAWLPHPLHQPSVSETSLNVVFPMIITAIWKMEYVRKISLLWLERNRVGCGIKTGQSAAALGFFRH